MDICEAVFKQKAFDTDKLISYGFTKAQNRFGYSVPIMENNFLLEVVVENNKAACSVVEIATNEPFVLFNIADASGAFVGKMRSEAEAVLKDIAEKCCQAEIFRCAQTKAIIAYAKEKYASSPEFLWEKFPDNAVLRRADNQKWYAALLTVDNRKLGLDQDGRAEILDLRGKPEEIETIVDGKKYFSGYHMNKKHWYTICLNGSVSDEEIANRLDASFALAKK